MNRIVQDMITIIVLMQLVAQVSDAFLEYLRPRYYPVLSGIRLQIIGDRPADHFKLRIVQLPPGEPSASCGPPMMLNNCAGGRAEEYLAFPQRRDVAHVEFVVADVCYQDLQADRQRQGRIGDDDSRDWRSRQ